MKPGPWTSAHYNEDFEKAVIKAYVLSKKTFIWHKNKYVTANYIADVANDIKRGIFKIDLIDIRVF